MTEAVAPPAESTVALKGRPDPLVRKAFGPLLGYHVLILLGAVFLVGGVLGRSSGSTLVGWGLVAAGLALFAAIAWWSRNLIRRGPPSQRGSTLAAAPTPSSRRVVREFCTACGWRGERVPPFCPRCGKVAVRLPPSASAVGETEKDP